MDVIIIGAGISGLSAAISLRRSGHKVTIYERSSLNNEVGAAIYVPPNAGRFLIPWGLDPVKQGFVASTGVYFMNPMTMQEQVFHDHSFSKQVFGQPLYHAHRVDLHDGLKELAVSPDGPGTPVVIEVKSDVKSFDSGTPSITLSDGTVLKADLVVAANGVNSTAAEVVNGTIDPPKPANDTNCCYRFLIHKSILAEDPETKWITEEPRSLGCSLFPDAENKRRLVEYTCRNGDVYNFVAMCNNSDLLNENKEDWHAGVSKTEVLENFTGYHPKLLAVINKATEVKRWPFLYRAPIKTWIKDRLVLVGDAAHPMLPHHAQGGAQGLEDGLALGLVMYGLASVSPSDISQRLEIYEKIRRNRAAAIQVMSNYGMDEEKPAEMLEFMEGKPVPTNPKEVIGMTYGHDVVKRTVDQMTEFDSKWSLPEGFFLPST